MTAGFEPNPCDFAEQVAAYALLSLPVHETARVRAHILSCPHCRNELDLLRPVIESFVAWPTDVIRPTVALSERLAVRIAQETGALAAPQAETGWREPDWLEVSPGIFCKLLATDAERHRVSMLVRLLPGVEYPAHSHAEFEELHLLAGELWIDDRKLFPGDYQSARSATTDLRVWSETGCTCVLVTSTNDILR